MGRSARRSGARRFSCSPAPCSPRRWPTSSRGACRGRSACSRAAWRAIIMRYAATLTHFSGDGMMVLLNAPVPCPDDPALRGVRMAGDMQAAVQALIAGWCARGHALGFGVGLAKGMATVGRIGYEGRHDYTAIGRVANLASRLCSAAEDKQILIDANAAKDVSATVPL